MAMEKKIRFNLTLTPAAKARMDSICAKSGESFSETVRKALALYDLALDAERGGGQIIIRKDGETDQRVILGY